ncbi:MAG: FkbM family methyltransferase [Myxococcales bacterium]
MQAPRAPDADCAVWHDSAGSKVSLAQLRREVEEYFAVGAAVAPGDTVVDVGANVGAFALAVAERCEGDVRLLCFEPSPKTYRALEQNFAAHPALKKTRNALYPVGLAGPEMAGQHASFYDCRRFPTNSTLDIREKRREFEVFFEDRGARLRRTVAGVLPGPLGQGLGSGIERALSSLPKGPVAWWISRRIMGLEEVKVRLETLEAVLQGAGVETVDLLKIDVEGHELEVLRGLGPDGWRKVRQVVVETHDRDGRQKAIEALLERNGLTQFRRAAQKTNDNGLQSVLVLARRG